MRAVFHAEKNVFKDFHIPGAKHHGKSIVPIVLEITALCHFSSLLILEKEEVGTSIQIGRLKYEKMSGSP